MHTEQWSVTIDIAEQDAETRASARLNTSDATMLTGTGVAHRHPHDRDVPAIGAELAVARALAELQHRLIDATIADIEQSTGVPSHLTG